MSTLVVRIFRADSCPTGNIAGPFFYRTNQAPTYTLGIWSMITSHLVQMAAILAFRTLLSMENRRRNRLQAEWGAERNLDVTAFSDMTDRENENFRYVY